MNKTIYEDYTPIEIDLALNHAFNERIDQKDFDVLDSVCKFAKRNYIVLVEKDNDE